MKTDKEKIEMYEALLHKIQLCAEVAMDGRKTSQLINNICNWSYAHRAGNGMLADEEQEKLIDKKFERLLETE